MPADLLMEPLAEARAGLALVLRAVQAIAVVVVEEHRCVPGRTIEDRIAVSPTASGIPPTAAAAPSVRSTVRCWQPPLEKR
jgi:hypothetical protein